ncbi:MAG: hypothetical protein M3352_06930 [Bacteroidota bacterium]|nr:hypothetical protein [Bacteroidota bacterium]
MKIFLICILIFLSSFTFAQFAIIQDKDGYCNVRKDTAANVTDTLNNGHFVYSFGKKGAWADINYTKNKENLRGYVYGDRLQLIADYESLPVKTNAANSITIGNDSLRVMVSLQKFDRTKNKLSYYKEDKSQLELVNGKELWGTDGGIPYTEYKSMIIFIGQRKIVLPKAALANLFEPRLSDTGVNYDRANDIIYIQSANSDGAGFYQVIWKIEKGVYKDRYIASGF